MAKNAADHLTYYLLLDATGKEQLAAVRHMANIKLAHDGADVWLKDIDEVQANSAIIKAIPFKTLFYELNGKLFKHGSALPDRTVPSLLWTPIDRAIAVTLPSLNHNYFGINSGINIRLIASHQEQPAAAMITHINTLASYMAAVPAVRLKGLKWCLLNNDQALIHGTPQLPINGDTYWQRERMLLPTGYDLELHTLAEHLQQLLNPEDDAWIIWRPDNTYALAEKDFMVPLTRDSFKQTTITV